LRLGSQPVGKRIPINKSHCFLLRGILQSLPFRESSHNPRTTRTESLCSGDSEAKGLF
jgi:hypothetical protein